MRPTRWATYEPQSRPTTLTHDYNLCHQHHKDARVKKKGKRGGEEEESERHRDAKEKKKGKIGGWEEEGDEREKKGERQSNKDGEEKKKERGVTKIVKEREKIF